MRVELTKRADYAIRAVLALARATDGELMSVRRVSDEQHIPVRFLPQVMTDLVRAGLADGVEGRRGGYRLARPMTSISLLDVIEAIEGDSRRRSCVLRGGPCSVNGVCDVHAAFMSAQEALLGRLADTSIGGLADGSITAVPSSVGG